jgi:gliding motility-associated-like protein
MIKRLFLHCFFFLVVLSKAQCPQVYNGLGVLSSNPYWISCAGTTTYVMGFQSNQSWGSYTLSWGDGAPNQTGASYVANTVINHTYTSAQPDTFVVTLQIPAQSCTLTGVVVLESSVSPSVTLPPGGSNQGCVPAVLQFSNASTGISKTTHFLWNFGDGSPAIAFTYTNGQTVSHTYTAVNCATAVTMQAWNYCTSTVATTYSPVQIFGKDTPSITADQLIRCWPSNVFTFTNNSTQNCPGQNNFQRKELWDFGQYWGNLSDSIYNWSNWPPTTPHSIAYPSPGTYSIQLRDSNACGISTVVVNITIFNSPTANVVAPAAPLCQNTPLTFTNASSPGAFYMWNFGDGGGFVNLGSGNKVHTYTVAGTYTVQLAAFLPGGGSSCTNTAAIVINILPQPSTGFTFSPGSGCTSVSNVSFTDTSVGANMWNWNFGNGNTSTLQVPPAQNYTNTGIYSISLSVTAANGCTNASTSTLGVFPTPTANFSPLIGCANSAVNFTNSSVVTGTVPITSYTWNFADGSPLDLTQNPSHTYTATGVYNVSLTVGSGICTASISQAFTVNPKPTAGFVTSPTVGCSSFSVSFTNTSTGQTSNLWNFGVVPTATTNAISTAFTYSNLTQTVQGYTAALYVSNAFGCVDSSKQVITVFPVPAVSFTGNPASGCAPITVNFTNNAIGASTYSWTFGDGNGSASLNPSNTYTGAGGLSQVYTVQLVATNSLGCSSTGSMGVTVFPKPVFTFSMNPPSGCSNLSVNFFTVAGATSYTWDFGDASPLSNLPNPTHVFTNTTGANVVYTVTMIATNAFGCADTSSDFVTVLPKPVADFSATPLAGCSPLNINFTNTSTNNSSNSWNFGNGQTSNSTNGSATYTSSPGSSSATYSVQLIVHDASICADSITKLITLYEHPLANFTADTPACSPKVITFTNTSTGSGNTYLWTFGNGSTSTQTNPTQTYTAGAAGSQEYTVQLVATTTNNCRDSYTANIVVHPQPAFNIVSSPDSGCAILRVNFANINSVQQYHWNFGDGSTSSGGGVSHSFMNTGSSSATYTVQLIAKDAFGCADTSMKTVKVYGNPTASFAASPLSLSGAQAVSFTNQSAGAVTYNWLFGDGASSAQFEPMYVYQQPGEYIVKLVAYSNKGCRDTFQLADKIVVQDENLIQIPNAFTPNQSGSPGNVYDPLDKSNDIFHVNMKNVESFKMNIFSRWGELLYETKNYREGWDGYFKGKLCQEDVYVWKVQATFTDGSKFDKTGDLQLIR